PRLYDLSICAVARLYRRTYPSVPEKYRYFPAWSKTMARRVVDGINVLCANNFGDSSTAVAILPQIKISRRKRVRSKSDQRCSRICRVLPDISRGVSFLKSAG